MGPFSLITQQFCFQSTANTAPVMAVLSGLNEVAGEQLLYLEVNQQATFRINGSDDGTFDFVVNSSSVMEITQNVDNGILDVTVRISNIDPQSLRYFYMT